MNDPANIVAGETSWEPYARGVDRNPSRRPRIHPAWVLVQLGELILVLGLAGLLFGQAPGLHPVARAALLFGAILALGSLNVLMYRRFMDR